MPRAAHLASLRERLAAEKLVVAFVAEFSRGKSELINAIFFADTGRRMLPATPVARRCARSNCGYDADDAARLRAAADRDPAAAASRSPSCAAAPSSGSECRWTSTTRSSWRRRCAR